MTPRLCKSAGAVGLALLALLASRSTADPILDPLRDFLVRTVTSFVSQSLAGSLEVGALRGSLLSAPVLHNVMLRNSQGEVVAHIAEIRLAYDLKSLLRKSLTVHTVEIVRPRLTLVQEPDGRLNLGKVLSPGPPEAPPAGGGLPFALLVESLQLRDGQITLGLPSLPGIQQVEGLQAQLSARIDQEGLRAQVQQFTAQALPAGVQVHTLQGAFQALGSVVRIDNLRLQMGETLITANGVLPGGTQAADFTLQMQPLALTEIGRLLQNDALHGELRLALQAEGPPDAIQISGQLRADNGNVNLQGQLNTTATPLRYHATLDVINLNLAAFVQGDALQSDLNLRLGIDGAGLAPQELQSAVHLAIHTSHLGRIALHPSHMQLAARQQRVEIRRFDLQTSVAQMTASGALDLAGNSDLQYALTAELTDLQQLLGMEPLAGQAHLQGQAQGDWPALRVHGTLHASALRYQDHALGTLQLAYDGRQLGDQPYVTAQLVAQQARVGTLPVEQMTLDATYQGAERQVRFATWVAQAANTGGEARGTLTLGDTGQEVILEILRIQLPDRTWQAVVPLEIALAPQRVQFKQVHLARADESITLSGAVEGEQLQDVRLHAAQIDLAALRQLLPLPDPVSGRATLQVQLAGTLAEPRLQGELVLQPESGEQLPFEAFRTTLAYAQHHLQSAVYVQQGDRTVLTLDLRLPVNLAFTALPLEQRLVDAPVAMRLQVQQPDLAAVQRWQPTLPGLSGTLQGAVTVQGTYATLSLDAEMQLQQLGIAEAAEQVHAPIRLAGVIVTAASVPELAQAIQQGQVRPQVQKLELRVPTLRGHRPAQGAPAEPFQVQDLFLEAAMQWTAQGLQATLPRVSLQASGLGLPPTDVLLGAQWTPSRLELTRLRVRLPESEVQGQGHLTLSEQQLQFRIHIPRLRLDTLPVSFPPTLPPVVQGDVTVRGSVQAPQMAARLQYAGGQIHADLAAQLQEPVPRYQAALRLEGLDIAQMHTAAQGRLQARGQLQGRGFSGAERQATLEVTAETRGLSLAPDITARLQANLAGDTLRLQQLRLSSAPAELTANGTLSATRPVAVHYTLTLRDLAALQQHLGLELQGRGNLTGEIRGTLDAMQTQGTLRLDAWRVADLQGQRLQATFSATQLPAAPRATLKAQLVEVQGPSLPPSTLSVEGTYAAQRGTFIVAVTQGPYQRTRLAGNVVLADGQRLTLHTLRLQHQDLVWENAGPVEMVRSLQGELQVRRLILRRNGQEIRVQGSLLPAGPVQATVQVQRLQISPTVQAFAPTLNIPDGRLSLDLTLGGTLQQPRLQGNLQLTALQWQQQELGDLQATVGMSGTSTMRTDLHWQRQGRELLQVRGTVGIGASDPLDLQIQAPALNLDLLPSLSAAVTSSAGSLTLDLQLTGTRQQPRARGSLALQDGTIQLAATGERYRDIQARVRFADERIEIERLHVGSRSGPLDVTGRLALAGLTLQQVEVSVQAQQFTAMHTPGIEAVVSTAVDVQGSLQDLSATGTITVPRARLSLKEIPGSGPRAVKPWQLTVDGVYGPGPEAVSTTSGAGSPSSGSADPLPFLRANLQVDLPRNVWIQGPGTAVEMSGNMEITKKRHEPFVLSGSIATVRGFASFYGKKFDLENGQVTFTGSPEINPLLDVTVARKVADYVVNIQATGKARQPTIALRSTPELPQIDILSLLLIGKTTDRLTSSEQTAFSSQAQQVAGNLIAGQLEKTLGKELGLDTIEVTAGNQLGTGSVRVGRYVTQDIFLSYERDLSGKEGNTVGVEYSFNRRLKLKGSSSDQGETAIDLLWRTDY